MITRMIVVTVPADKAQEAERLWKTECAPLMIQQPGCASEEFLRNREKSRVRSKVEHVFQVMKVKFGFAKVRYRGLKKNANRLFATCALVNLYLARRVLLPTA